MRTTLTTDALSELLANLRRATRGPAVPPALFLGSYPPRECGIATFTRDVVESLESACGTRGEVIAVEQAGAELIYGSDVVATLCDRDPGSYREVAGLVNDHPAGLLNVQHEYGLFGGEDGEMLLGTFERIRKPIVLTLHTVLPKPSEHHMRVARELCERADVVVALSQTGRTILQEIYGLDPRRVHVIHHGVPDEPFAPSDAFKAPLGLGGRLVVSTFGLISRGKGLEYALDALPAVVERHPEVLYLIIGETHPVVRRNEGESYREMLAEKIAELGLQDNVSFINRYLTLEQLIAYLRATDVYLTPYLNPVQIASGTLAYAMGLGKATVSTPYLYAEELLAGGRGCLAGFRDAGSIATQVNRLLDDPALRRCIERRAYRFARQMTWPHVAREYGRLFAYLCGQTQPVFARPLGPGGNEARVDAQPRPSPVLVPAHLVPIGVLERDRRVIP